jgi:hypothetical protein
MLRVSRTFIYFVCGIYWTTRTEILVKPHPTLKRRNPPIYYLLTVILEWTTGMAFPPGLSQILVAAAWMSGTQVFFLNCLLQISDRCTLDLNKENEWLISQHSGLRSLTARSVSPLHTEDSQGDLYHPSLSMSFRLPFISFFDMVRVQIGEIFSRSFR